jgi:hypothetical protein
MYHLVYTSHATHPFSEPDLIGLLKECREFNRKNGITGMLLYIQGKFIQVLEGQKEVVIRLFEGIAQDPRHQRVAVIIEGESCERIFKDWSMGFRRLTEQEALHLSGFRDIDQFFARKRITEESNLLLVFLKLFYRQNMVEFEEV